jgi:hypothetical protein
MARLKVSASSVSPSISVKRSSRSASRRNSGRPVDGLS